MKINSDLGYEPVLIRSSLRMRLLGRMQELRENYEILMSKERKNCMCTAMLYDPKIINLRKKLQGFRSGTANFMNAS